MNPPPRLAVRMREVPRVAAEQVLVRVEASSVNPIDVKRAGGYSRRLLGLKGAATFPLVLGNDVAGTVEAVDAGVPAPAYLPTLESRSRGTTLGGGLQDAGG